MIPDFSIDKPGLVSDAFREKSITRFTDACSWVKELPFRRNMNKSDPLCVLKDEHGTCGARHAVLKSLAAEQNFSDLKLILGIFRMNRENAPAITPVLDKWGLDYIPEAHNYLRYREQIVDVTFPGEKVVDFESELMQEREIEPWQIDSWKVKTHQEFLQEWLKTEGMQFSPNQIWQAREECVAVL